MAEDIPRAPASFEDCRRLIRRFEASFNLPLGVILARGVGAITGPYHDYESKKKTKNLMVNSLDLTHCDYEFFVHLFPSPGRKNGFKKLDLFCFLYRIPYHSPMTARN